MVLFLVKIYVITTLSFKFWISLAHCSFLFVALSKNITMENGSKILRENPAIFFAVRFYRLHFYVLVKWARNKQNFKLEKWNARIVCRDTRTATRRSNFTIPDFTIAFIFCVGHIINKLQSKTNYKES